jgi:hypothetical protein
MLKSNLISCLALGAFLLPDSVSAGPISINTWYEFSFTDVGVQARGCDPNDPLGNFCVPSSGTPSQFLDAPPWTFTTTDAIRLSVVDAFASGDQFELFDFGVSLGKTSVPVTAVDCGDDPVVCLGTAGMSQGAFWLAAGSHSLTITPSLSADGGGSGFLLAETPEPSSIAMIGLGGVLLGLIRRRRPLPRNDSN